MANVLIVAYLLIVLALVTVILLQRSEGGGLGMGGSSNGFMSVRGTANVLTRTTGILAALFFAAAIGLTLLNGADHTTANILDRAAAPVPAAPGKPAESPSVLDALNAAQKQTEAAAGIKPTTPAPATPAPAAATPSSTPANQDAPNVALPANDNASAPATGSSSGTTSTPAATGTTTAPASTSGTTTAPASTTGSTPSDSGTSTTSGSSTSSGTSTPAPASTDTTTPAQPATN